jgi:molybdopterin-guanine dinucleotide biosynthesis protein
MNIQKNINRLYADVSDSIGNAMADILALNVDNKDGKREIGNITDKLREIQNRFDSELHQLKTHAEWDTFTLAFFGETNAGKSTIIESLRILFKEESREALLKHHADDLEKFTQALSIHLKRVREGLHALYSEYTGELTAISHSTARLEKIIQNEAQERNAIAQAEADARTRLVQQEVQIRLEAQQKEAEHRQQLAATEAAARNKLAEQETSARLAAEQQEATQRLQIVQVYAESRFKLRLALFGIGGCLMGTTVAVALLKLTGA